MTDDEATADSASVIKLLPGQAPVGRTIVLFGDGRDWHGRTLERAFRKRGLHPVSVPLFTCGFSSASPFGLNIPGVDALPEAAFVRFVPGGSFEQVTMYLGVLHALREMGVPVWNDARAIERCVDKSTTTFLMERAGLATPRTLATGSRTLAEAFVADAMARGEKVVQKPLFGAQGKGLRLLESPGGLAPSEEISGLYYLQEFIASPDGRPRDWRLFVSAGRVLASMIRHGQSWITNIKQGARPEAAIAPREMAEMAVRATACTGADYAGVDIIQAADGRYLVLEVNSMPAWNGLQQVTHTRISEAVVADFLRAALPAPALEQHGP